MATEPVDAADKVPKLRPLSRNAAAVRSVALDTRFCVSRRSSARRAADESSMADLDLPEVPLIILFQQHGMRSVCKDEGKSKNTTVILGEHT